MIVAAAVVEVVVAAEVRDLAVGVATVLLLARVMLGRHARIQRQHCLGVSVRHPGGPSRTLTQAMAP